MFLLVDFRDPIPGNSRRNSAVAATHMRSRYYSVLDPQPNSSYIVNNFQSL